jgi:hypothetical protein
VLRGGPEALEGRLTLEAPEGATDCADGIPVRLDGDRFIFARDVTVTYPALTACRERFVRAAFRSTDGAVTAESRLLVQTPWPWELSGPYPERRSITSVPTDPAMVWRHLPPEKIFARFGAIDFEQAFGNGACGYAYLRTKIRLAEDTDVLLLLNADDTAEIWMDGEPLIKAMQGLPAEAYLARERRRISAGVHTVFAEAFQSSVPDGEPYNGTQNWWTMRLRVRSERHVPSPVEGIPFASTAPVGETPSVPGHNSDSKEE